MRVALHDFSSDPSLTQRDGVNLAHENIASLLRTAGSDALQVAFHDFNRLLSDREYAQRELSRCDCVVANVGPHAHYYFLLREQLGLDFRIVRDVRTALWSSYIHQEYLLQPLLRDSDTLLVASRFTRGIYERLFPHLADFPVVVCYPLTAAFPPGLPDRPARRPDTGDAFTLGYIGRLSDDKNFPDVVELLIHLNRTQEKRYRLLACGDVHSASCHPDRFRNRLQRALGEGNWFEHLPPRANTEIWDVYARLDALVFPSTSNLETLGRVLVEASHAGVPIVCGDHAAATELVPPASACAVEYREDRQFSTHDNHPLGRVRIRDMADALTRGDLPVADCHRHYAGHVSRFLHLVTEGPGFELAHKRPVQLTPAQSRFIERIDMQLPEPLDAEAARGAIAGLVPWFLGLQRKDDPLRRQLTDELQAISGFPERTRRFIRKSAGTRCDFTDIGGIDIELCHVTGFHPRFEIRKASSGPRLEVAAS